MKSLQKLAVVTELQNSSCGQVKETDLKSDIYKYIHCIYFTPITRVSLYIYINIYNYRCTILCENDHCQKIEIALYLPKGNQKSDKINF